MKKILFAVLALVALAGMAFAGSATLETDRRGQAIQGALTPMVAQKITYDAATSNSTAFLAPIVRVTATTACFIRFGPAATGYTATTSYHYMGAGTTEYFKTRGLGYISAIKSATAGTLYISEME